MKKKVVYILSDLDYALAFHWLLNHFSFQKFDLQFVLIESDEESTTLEKLITAKQIPVHKLTSPKNSRSIGLLLKMTRLLHRIRPDVVHCHMRRSNLYGLSAAWLLRVPRRIYTRHYSTQNHRFFPHAVKTDRLLNRFATKILAPSETVQKTLIEKERVPPAKVALVPHGFDLDYFKNASTDRVDSLKKKFQISEKEPVIGVISRYLELKGWDFIIPAFESILRNFPNAVLLISNASGPYTEKVRSLLQRLPESAYREITFEKDLAALYGCMDCFIHTPIDEEIEAFGQVYIEALAAGIPSVFTLSGIANSMIQAGENALVVEHQNSEQISDAVTKILRDPVLQKKLIESGRQTAESFDFKSFMNNTEALYG